MLIGKDTVVTLTYQLTTLAGEQLEEATTEAPAAYLHGGYDGIFPKVEAALEGKAVGAELDLVLEPDDAFGEYDHQLVEVEQRSAFPKDVAIGMQFEGGPENSDEDDFMLYTVVDVTDDEVTVDGNHPLAGKTLTFNCSVVGVRPATEEELAHGQWSLLKRGCR